VNYFKARVANKTIFYAFSEISKIKLYKKEKAVLTALALWRDLDTQRLEKGLYGGLLVLTITKITTFCQFQFPFSVA
jgi:hypothetical protein